MNHLKEIKILKNNYFLIRHGESKANVAGIVLSNPDIGTEEYGLSEKGRKQVYNSIKMNNIFDKKTIIYSSDFLRTRETAQIVKDYFKTGDINYTKKLRERFFGDLDQKENLNYKKVWIYDREDANQKKYNVESVNQVMDRVTGLIIDLESNYENQKILLVSHGDPLQILITAFLKNASETHRDIEQLKVAEIRKLILKNI